MPGRNCAKHLSSVVFALLQELTRWTIALSVFWRRTLEADGPVPPHTDSLGHTLASSSASDHPCVVGLLQGIGGVTQRPPAAGTGQGPASLRVH